VRGRTCVDDRALFIAGVYRRPWAQLEGDGDQVRRGLDARLRHLTPRVMPGVSRMRLREIGEIARRERRGDRRRREREEADRKKSRQARSVSGADHDAAALTRIRPSRGRANSVETRILARRSVDIRDRPPLPTSDVFVQLAIDRRHSRRTRVDQRVSAMVIDERGRLAAECDHAVIRAISLHARSFACREAPFLCESCGSI